jgi:hypothetical protein
MAQTNTKPGGSNTVRKPMEPKSKPAGPKR